MINWLKQRLRDLAERILYLTKPYQDELVLFLILHTASLELPHGECMELAPLKGCCGPFKLYGNSLPVIKYRVFDKKLKVGPEGTEKTEMHFVEVTVEVSKPDRTDFYCSIDSKTNDPSLHGMPIPVKEKYKEPFNQLAFHLFRYFPFQRQQGK